MKNKMAKLSIGPDFDYRRKKLKRVTFCGRSHKPRHGPLPRERFKQPDRLICSINELPGFLLETENPNRCFCPRSLSQEKLQETIFLELFFSQAELSKEQETEESREGKFRKRGLGLNRD